MVLPLRNQCRLLFLLVLLAVTTRIHGFTSIAAIGKDSHLQTNIVGKQSDSFFPPLKSSTDDTSTSGNPALATTTAATELPDSLSDAAEQAARASAQFVEASGGMAARCRIDFDTSAGDETYTLLKQSSEFMQELVSFSSYQLVPGLMEQIQSEKMKVAQARAELQTLLDASNNNEEEEEGEEAKSKVDEARKEELIQILSNNGRAPDYKWEGPIGRVYFPDEGSAALARRDWMNPDDPKVPPCVVFSSCGGVQMQEVEKDMLVFFFCPKASESEYVEELLQKTELNASQLKLTVFVNPNLVDMGVTGFGMAGRRLRERLLDGLTNVYYLRTLQWGALTRLWPQAFSVWQEDENSEGGYKLIRTLNYLPSNPEVEDIYDVENGGGRPGGEGGGFLDQFGDFVNGMMRL